MASCNAPKSIVIHKANKNILISIHSLEEQVLKLLVENVLEVINAVCHARLTQLFVGHCGFTDLLEEKLVCLGEFSSKTLV